MVTIAVTFLVVGATSFMLSLGSSPTNDVYPLIRSNQVHYIRDKPFAVYGCQAPLIPRIIPSRPPLVLDVVELHEPPVYFACHCIC
ncbi:hypothetical protein BYT27DRAFT_7188865 [Phlegmacium glaucopus]|nr:hypothetical protein BYT27DRAFT_7188865 [Phlegmacium glaucopus]